MTNENFQFKASSESMQGVGGITQDREEHELQLNGCQSCTTGSRSTLVFDGLEVPKDKGHL